MITEKHRELAREAMNKGFNDCKLTYYFGGTAREQCDCDHGATDGCKARVEAIAVALALSPAERGGGE